VGKVGSDGDINIHGIKQDKEMPKTFVVVAALFIPSPNTVTCEKKYVHAKQIIEGK
jgi:hypothetical protein